MEQVDRHGEIQALLGAFALDAVGPEEAEQIERHLAVCARCRAGVVEHLQVASLLAYPGSAAPEGVWERIVAQLEEAPPALRLDRFQPMGQVHGSTETFEVEAARAGRLLPFKARRSSRQRPFLIGLAAAAAAVAAVLGVQVVRLGRQTSRLPAVSSTQANQAAWQVAMSSAGARRVTLTSTDRSDRMLAVVLPDGTSFLGPTNLPALPRDETYQLWGVVGGDRISLAVVGAKPAYQAFSTPAMVSGLALTVERARGVVAPTKTPVVAATLAGA